MSYLITGGTGFIGSYVLRRIVRAGGRVVAYDLEPDRNAAAQVLTPEELEQVLLVRGDICDAPLLYRTIKENQVACVLHLASLLIPACDADPRLALRVVCEGFTNVLEAARLFDLRRVVWTSSVAVFGSPNDHHEEYVPNDAPHHPRTVYGACKSLNEYMAVHYARTWDIDVIGLRFAAVYGLGRMRGVSAFATDLMEKPALGRDTVVRFGDDVIDWQYAEDAASMVLRAAEVERTNTRCFNTCCDVRSVSEAAAYVRRLFPEVRVNLEPGSTGIVWKTDATPLREELGFQPAYSMERGIIETVNGFRARAGLPDITLTG
jgi:UDP-glucose 4-epimerase